MIFGCYCKLLGGGAEVPQHTPGSDGPVYAIAYVRAWCYHNIVTKAFWYYNGKGLTMLWFGAENFLTS